MDILKWIKNNRNGKIKVENDLIEVFHENEEHSSIWINATNSCPEGLDILGDFYKKYDGMDLFCSTFKIAASTNTKYVSNVALLFTLNDLKEEVKESNIEFPEKAIPFMYQAGIGYYAVAKSGIIYEWDSELQELSGEYDSIEEIFNEWLNAISKSDYYD